MKSNDEYRDEAIDFFMGAELKAGDIVGCREYELSTLFLRYEENIAIVLDKPSGKELRFPKDKMFDVNAVKDRAVANKISDLNKLAMQTKNN